ncbi:MAG: glycosyltransferase family 4 protein [Gemmatimonadaceae bacterium]
MKILMLAPPPHLKGPLPKHTPHLVAALRALGCEVVTEVWGRHHDVESLGTKVFGRVGDIWRVRRALHRERPDVLVVKTSHDWNTLLRDVPLLLVAGARAPRIVVQMHGSQPETLTRAGQRLFAGFSRRLLSLCDAVMLLSSDERRQWEQFYPEGKFVVVANPFVGAPQKPAGDAPDVSRALAGVPPGAPLLLFVGRLIPGKGIFGLLDAVAELDASTPWHLLVAGEGEAGARVAERVRALGLEGRVTLAGYLRGDALDAAYRAATVFALPTWWMEGFPTVIAEAMGAGLPIVTTPIRGIADHLKDGVNAVFVPPRDRDALRDALRRVLGDASLRASMAAANREAVEKFAPAVVGRDYLAALTDVVRQPPRRGQRGLRAATSRMSAQRPL